MPTIDNELCMGCGKCMDVCGFGALILDVKAIPNNEKCISCGMCKGHCPFNAITVKDVEKQEKIRQIKKWALAYAKVNGFNVNPDEKVVDTIIEGLLKKEGKFGARYCPCRIQNVRKNVCPCVYHKDEIKKDGACHCLFFVK